MNRVANLVLAFEDERAYTLLRSRFSSRQARGTTTNNQYVPIFWHEQPSL
jgi:hypothetical protein